MGGQPPGPGSVPSGHLRGSLGLPWTANAPPRIPIEPCPPLQRAPTSAIDWRTRLQSRIPRRALIQPLQTPVKRVLIADDHPIFRRGIAALLSTTLDFEVVAQAGTADETLAIVREMPIDIVLLDIVFPDA